MFNLKFSLLVVIVMVQFGTLNAQYDIYHSYDYENVDYSLEDLGTMWTFDNIPLEKWEEKYGFKPTKEWLDDVRMSALQFGGGCSAAFVSGDGLIMTNHHCGRGDLSQVQKEGENLLRDGFYAKFISDERRIPGLYVDQLMFIKDITAEIYEAMSKGENENDKVNRKNQKVDELKDKYEKETGLTCRVIPFYNGGKYKVYGYKRYNDIRLVMAPDFQIAATGWDWDNFTYPRYELDFAFYRAYDEEGNPVKSKNYFSWSEKGAEEGEPIFVIGRPGSTKRLISVAEMMYLRDYEYKYRLNLFNGLYQVYYELFHSRPENESELLHGVLSWGNGRKSYAGRLLGLKDPYIMAKKIDFEKNLQKAVYDNSELNNKYGHVWDSISETLEELKQYIQEASAFRLPRFAKPIYFNAAAELIKYAEQLKLPKDKREEDYVNGNAVKHLKGLYPKEYDEELNKKLLRAHSNYVCSILPADHWLTETVYGHKHGEESVEYLLNKSQISNSDKVMEFIKKSPDEILSSDDPFIFFIRSTQDKLHVLNNKISEIRNTLEVLNQMLGEIIFAVHGEMIPPDATSSLRISDGVIAGYEYNGTIAPGKTTYFGLYDRYYSFNQKTYPWGLHERWLNPPPELDLTTPICFVSTNDIFGGNSGSSVINMNGEVIGLFHDGNLESLAGDFIFVPENNRAVATDSFGLMEALIHIFKTDKLVKELKEGQLVE